MKTLERRQLQGSKVAHIYRDDLGGYYVAIEQTYNNEVDVLQTKTYQTIAGVNKFVKSWS